MKNLRSHAFGLLLTTSLIALAGCSETAEVVKDVLPTETADKVYSNNVVSGETIDISLWPAVSTPDLDPAVESQIDDLISKMTLEQKVGQVIQADSNAVTPEEVKQYRLGSVLSGGNSAPGDFGRTYRRNYGHRT